jgi:hypothetical protein
MAGARERMEELGGLLEAALISHDEYESKRTQILHAL